MQKTQNENNQPPNASPPADSHIQSQNTNQSNQTTMRKKSPSSLSPKTALLAVVIVLAGVVSGYGLNQAVSSPTSAASESRTAKQASNDFTIEVGKAYGSDDGDIFTDDATGVLVAGGFEGEGTHRLLRPGGETQTICLTSSIMDLDLFEGHEVEVTGQTYDTQKCPWFMDAGRVKVVELNVEPPFEVGEE